MFYYDETIFLLMCTKQHLDYVKEIIDVYDDSMKKTGAAARARSF
jgi:hypothetical protein